jgi:hypothetical protein
MICIIRFLLSLADRRGSLHLSRFGFPPHPDTAAPSGAAVFHKPQGAPEARLFRRLFLGNDFLKTATYGKMPENIADRGSGSGG